MFKRLISIIFLFGTITVMAQKIEFRADINEMSPMSYPARSGLSGFSFEMRNDSAFVHLPYMGEVYNPTYSNDGLNFDAPCCDLTVKPTKKKDGQIIAFTLKHDIVASRRGSSMTIRGIACIRLESLISLAYFIRLFGCLVN